MTQPAPLATCAGCGAVIDPLATLAFRCPEADQLPTVDHVLTPRPDTPAFPSGGGEQPFQRYRDWTLAGRLARVAGLPLPAYDELVEELDSALVQVCGRGVRRTPLIERPDLAAATDIPGLRLWVKDETGQAGGSHKIRHLMAVMLYLRLLETTSRRWRQTLRSRPLAIASCGNAALAAATLARAADWPIRVFIPDDAEASVVAALKDLGAGIDVCVRAEGESGDPCVLRFREAVAAGALPFSVQGPDNGVAVSGSRLIAYEMAEDLAAAGERVDRLYIQTGGGAFGSGIAHGLAEMAAFGVIDRRPILLPVQTEGCHPLVLAYRRLSQWQRENRADAQATLDHAASHRDQFMAPWPGIPHSIAHGILDDETYDWLGLMEPMIATATPPVVATEAAIERAAALAKAAGINASTTGAAGLAGLLTDRPENARVAVILSGIER